MVGRLVDTAADARQAQGRAVILELCDILVQLVPLACCALCVAAGWTCGRLSR